MRPSLRALTTCAVLSGLVGFGGAPAGATALPPLPPLATPELRPADCATVTSPLQVRCHAWVKVDPVTHRPMPSPSGPTSGYTPADLQSAYNLASAAATRGWTQTIAIVDAYDDPNAEADLAVYRSTFGLPACTTANGCFRKVNQYGLSNSPPTPDVGWSYEISLDLDMASAICPLCKILLVEANGPNVTELAVAVQAAAAQGATVISNSYGMPESVVELALEPFYAHPGVPITASTGDSGYGVSYPAASAYVTAVGGTRLVRNTGVPRGWSETAWSGAGSGCSAWILKQAWQTDPNCQGHTTADVSAVADPGTGVAVYDTYGAGGWLVFGGTSVSAPIIAGVYALNGHVGSPPVSGAAWPYLHPGDLYDVTSGSNGTCTWAYFCTAGPGYDGPTGLGTPNGTGAFGAVDPGIG